jgi:hypothetical protein
MPKYEAVCVECRTGVDYVSSVIDRDNTPVCPDCGRETTRMILTPPKGFVKGNFEAFVSPVDKSVISTDRELREHNKRNNVVNVHEGFDEAKVVAGDFCNDRLKPDKKEIAADIIAAARQIESGYKPPVREAYDD